MLRYLYVVCLNVSLHVVRVGSYVYNCIKNKITPCA